MDLLEWIEVEVLERTRALHEGRKSPGIISTDSLPKFRHINAESIEDALFWLQRYGRRSAIIAGGTDLLRELKNRSRPSQPEFLLNIKTVQPSLSYIEEGDSRIRLGSVTTLHAVATHESIRAWYGILAQAASTTRGPQHRNMATIGGDLCQQVKCWYHRASGNAFFCRRKGGTTCFAVDGDNRYHGIFGDGPCVAASPSDIAPVLVALDASVSIVGSEGMRSVPVENFFTTVGTILKPEEIVTEVRIPAPRPESQSSFVKFGVGNVFGRALVNVAIVATMKGEVCREAHIVLGAVSPTPWRAVQAEQLLAGGKITESRAEEAAVAATREAAPLSMNAYKVGVVISAVKRAILEMARKA